MKKPPTPKKAKKCVHLWVQHPTMRHVCCFNCHKSWAAVHSESGLTICDALNEYEYLKSEADK